METKLALFEWKEIRKTIFNNEWWFSIEDIVFALTSSTDTKQYIRRLRDRDEELKKGWVQFVLILEMETKWWKQKMNCVNTRGAFRIIQSIPSQKAEPFKQWLAQVWYERIQEIENPELAMKRAELIYEQKWYSKEWVDKRLRWIAVRKTLTDEWDNRWIKNVEYWILTAEISKATFWMTPMEYKQYKWLTNSKQSLRDHMTDLELIFTMLWESSTTAIMGTNNSQWFEEVKEASKEWWEVAWIARKELEKRTKGKVSSKTNFLPESKKTLK
jgi:prophage antirepressor-like protein